MSQDPKKNIETFYPLSPTQQGILFHCLAAAPGSSSAEARSVGSGMYVGQMRFRLEGELDEAALRHAWEAVLARHGALRTSLRWKDLREPIQVVARRVDLPFETLDWRHLDPADQEDRLGQLLRHDLERGFDLTRAPLLRLTLIRRHETIHELLWTRHHLIVDGWSVSLVFQEVLRHYVATRQGAPLALEAAPSYRDYIVWQRRQDLAKAEAIWRGELEGLRQTAPLDYGTPEATTDDALAGDGRWAERETEIPWDTTAALSELGKRHGLTLASWVQAAWAILLGRLQNRDTVVFGTVVSGRPAALAGVQGMVGLFINTQPLRTGVPNDRPLLDWARDLQSHQASLRRHEHLALHQIQGWSELPRGREMFETLLVYENYPLDPLANGASPGLDATGLRIVPILGRERTNYPLTLVVRQGRTLPISAIFDRGRLSSPDVGRLLDQLGRLLAGFAEAPERPIGELPWLSDAEQHQLLVDWQGPRVTVDTAATLDGLVRAQAERAPAAIAVEQDGNRLGYGELVDRGDAFAASLHAAGVRQGDRVAIGLERSPSLLVALLGVLRLGAAYVPLDPDYPRARLAFVLDDARPRALVVEPGSPLAELAAEGCPVVPVTAGTVAPLPPRQPLGAGLAYVIYTSGSTGWPKGVQITHRTVVNFLAAMARRPGCGPDDVLLAVTSLSFDISVLELFLPLSVGGRVVVATRQQAADGRALRQLIASSGATVLQATPATWRLLDSAGFDACPPFRQLSGGEALSRELARRRLAGGAALWNLYGPTETTIWSSVAEVHGEGDAVGLAPVDLGRPIDNTQLHAVDRHGRLLPAGAAGELWIGGDGLARGYLDRPGLTAERFVPDLWGAEPGRRLYRTGDLVRRRGEGSTDPGVFDYLGRIDFQVKVRGHRIELGEVEAVLERLPSVDQAVAVVRPDARGEGRLVAYIVPTAGARPTVEALRRDTGRDLPAVMVPAVFMTLDALPLTPNGKVDRQALPEPGGERPDLATALVRPRTEVERTVAATWAKVLELDEVGLDDNFFDLGGHSILAIRVHEELVATFEVELTLVELFEHPTVATLARRIGQLMDRETVDTHPTTPPRRSRSSDDDPGIAVVGLAGRFPGAPSVAALWRQLLAGIEGIRDFTDDEIAEVMTLGGGLGVGALDDPALVRRRGVLDAVDRFDAPFFGINPREAELLDPQHRLFLEVAAEALDDAGHPDETAGPIGVFAGTSMSGYLIHHVLPHLQRRGFDAAWQMVLGNDKDHLATRVAYLLGLTGPAVLVQTACSTSLVAVHMARRALLAGECDLALAGGAAVRIPQTLPLRHQPGGITSPDGRCRPFDAAAEGTVGGNGVGAVVLRRLDDALAEGDTVHAILRGSAINNDGHHKVGYTAPSVEGQSRVIRAALDDAGIDPATLGFVEAHGTGTSLGDPIEVEALHRALRGEAGFDKASCALGSIKGNLGHLDTAAGIAGLIKTVLAVEHGIVPPTLHFETPNPRIAWDDGPFFVPVTPTPWPKTTGPRRAGVSSFGLGGTNVHVVLEQAPEPPVLSPEGRGDLQETTLLLSAKTRSALERGAARLADHLDEHPGQDLADVAFTLAVGRRHHDHRRALTVGNHAEAVAALRLTDPARVRESVVEQRPAWNAFLFPGQGTAWVGMGRELYTRPGVFRDVLERCDAILREPLGESLLEALYGPTASDAALAQTRLAQPAVFALSHALAEQWAFWGVETDVLLGHSVGEYVAAHRAGVFELETALTLVARRGALMQTLPPGSMLALPVSASRFEELLAEHGTPLDGGPGLDLAAENGPEAVVASGPSAVIDRFAQRLEAVGIEGRRLRTLHAFHSAMMDPILDAFGDEVSRHRLAPPRVRVLSNHDGQPLSAERATSPDYWVRHLRGTVRFGPGLATLLAEPGAGLLLEVGPGRSLTALARRQAHSAERRAPTRVVASLARGRGETPDDAVRSLDRAVAEVWLAGAGIDWQRVHDGASRHRISLPPTAFDDHRFWLDPGPASAADPGLHLHWPSWRQDGAVAAGTAPDALTVLAPDDASGRALAATLPGVDTTVVALGDIPTARFDDIETLRTRLTGTPSPRVWLGVGWVEGGAGWHRDRLLAVVEALMGLGDDGELVVLTRSGEEVLGNESLDAEAAAGRAIAGWGRRHGLRVRLMDGVSEASPWWAGTHPMDRRPGRVALRGTFWWVPETVTSVVEGEAREIAGDFPGIENPDVLAHRIEPTTDLGRPLAERLADALADADATLDRLGAQATEQGASAVLLHHDLAILRGDDLLSLAVVEHLADRVRRLDRDSETVRWRLLGWTVENDGGVPDTPRDRRRLVAAVDRLLAPESLSTAWVGPADLDTWLALRAASPTATATASMGFRPDTGPPFVAPEGETEASLAAIWEDLLGIAPIGRFDDFFELGGHSLLGTQMMARVTATLGRELSLRALFDTPTLHDLAAALDTVAADGVDEGGTEGSSSTIPTVDRTGPLALSFAQQRLWFLDQLEPGTAVYNLPFALRLDGTLDRRALHRALGALVARHEVLRTRFESDRGEPRQVVGEVREHPLPTIDLGALAPERRPTVVRRIARLEARTAFDLSRGDLLRARLIRLSITEHVLTVTVHHIVADGWSLGVVVRELGALYGQQTAGPGQRRPPLPELPIQYADFAAWQRDWLSGERLEAQLDHWHRRLDGASTALDLPTDRPRPAMLDGRGGELRFTLESEVVEGARALARRHGATLFMVLLAAFDALLHRITGQRDLVVGSPVANRTRVEAEGLIGFFVNTLVLRTDLGGDPDFGQLVGRVKETSLDAQAHQDVPFELLVQELQPERDLSRSPLFQVLFILQNTPIEPLDLPGLSLSPVAVDSGAATFDLTLSLSERSPATGRPTLGATFGYRHDLFDRTTIGRIAAQYARLLTGAVAEPGTPLAHLPLSSEAERHQMVHELAPGAAAEPMVETLPERLHRQAETTPDAVAIIDTQGTTTYAELHHLALQIGHHLRRLGVGPETPVGVALERTHDLVATLWGVMAAGGTFVPLDPQHPEPRLRRVMADAGLEILVTDSATDEPVGNAAGRDFAGHRIRLDAPEVWPPLAPRRERGLEGEGSRPLPGPLCADALAYILFTSGSTGRPKGVAIRHGSLLAFLDAMAERPGLGAGDTLAAVTTLSFDISMLELFLPLIRGGRLALIEAETAGDPHALARRLDTVGATVMQATPAGWHQLLEMGWDNPRGVRIFCGGEALPRALADRLAACSPAVWNLYGPTEATVWISVAEVREGDGYHQVAANVPANVATPGSDEDMRPPWPVDLGRPLPGARLEVLDHRLRPVPLGVAGELYLAGPALARGYFALPGRTAAVFVPDPIGQVSGGRLYRTGDLVRRDARGRLIFLGRVDHQVKVRGFRIELGEIEAALLRHPRVTQAVVMARTQRGDTELVAYVVATGGTPGDAEAPTVAEWRGFLTQHLPAYMVPTVFVTLDAFPTNTSGKIDRKALPEPERGRSASAPFVAPRDPVEEAVAAIWREVLSIERVGIHDGFFDLGGHSLLATQVTSRVFETFQIELPLRRLFADPTIAGLSEAVRKAQAESLDSAEEELLRRIEAMSDDDLDDELAQLLASEVENP